MVGALARFWHWRGYVTEARGWMARAVSRDGGTAAARSHALTLGSLLEWRYGVLEGELTFRFAERTEQAPAGSFVFCPAGVAHTFGNSGTVPARFLELFVPGGNEGYNVERAALEQATPAGDAQECSKLDPQILGALARKYGIEFVD